MMKLQSLNAITLSTASRSRGATSFKTFFPDHSQVSTSLTLNGECDLCPNDARTWQSFKVIV